MTKKDENFSKSKFFWLDEPNKFSSLYKTKNILLLPNKIFLNQRIKIIKSFLKKEINATALDIGCGSGEFTYILKDYYNKVIGIDISDKMISVAQNNFKSENLIFKKSDCENIDLNDETANIIFALGLFDYVYDIQKVINEFKRILKKRGEIIFTIPKNPSIFLPLRLMSGLRYKMFDAPPIVNALSKKELIHLSEKNNFKIKKLVSLWTTTWIAHIEIF